MFAPSNNPVATARQVSKPARVQPQGAVRIDWSNPITGSLYAVFVAGNGGAVIDPVKGNWIPSAPFPIGYGNAGRGLLGDGSTTPYYTGSILSNPSTVNGGANFVSGTVILVVRYSSNTNTAVFINGIGNNWIGISGGQYTYGNSGQSAATACIPGKDQVIVYTVGLDNVGVIWVDGVKSTTTFAPNGLISSNGTPVLMQFGANGNYIPYGLVYQTAFFSRQFSPAEIVSITANPWQIFKTTQLFCATPVAAAISGAMYTAGISESGTLGETISTGAAAIMVSMAEAGSAVDADTALAIYLASNPEILSSLENPTASANFISNLVDSGTLSELENSVLSTNASISDSGTLSELENSVLSTNASISDSGTLSELESSSFSTNASISDSGALVEIESNTLSTSASIADSGTLVELDSGNLSTNASTTDTGNAIESSGSLLVFLASLIESGTSVELSSAYAAYVASLNDSGAANENSLSILSTNSSNSEPLASVDSASLLGAGSVSNTDSLNSAENTSNNAAFASTNNDSLASTENVFNSAIFVSANSDSGSVVDSTVGASINGLSYIDTVNASDNSPATIAVNAIISEVSNGLDTVFLNYSTSASYADTLSVNDVLLSLSNFASVIAESVNTLENIYSSNNKSASISDVLSGIDSVVLAVISSLSILDNLNATENYAIQLSTLSNIIDTLNVLEALTSIGGTTPPSTTVINSLRVFAVKYRRRINSIRQ